MYIFLLISDGIFSCAYFPVLYMFFKVAIKNFLQFYMENFILFNVCVLSAVYIPLTQVFYQIYVFANIFTQCVVCLFILSEQLSLEDKKF